MGGATVQRELEPTNSGRSRIASGKGLIEPLITLEDAKDRIKSIKDRLDQIREDNIFLELRKIVEAVTKILDSAAQDEIKNSETLNKFIKTVSRFVSDETLKLDRMLVKDIEKEVEKWGYSIWANRIINDMNRLEGILSNCTIEEVDKIDEAMQIAKSIEKIAKRQRQFFSGRHLDHQDQEDLHDINNIFVTLSYKIEIAKGTEGDDNGLRVSGLRQAHFGASFVAQTLKYQKRGHTENELNIDAIIPFAYELISNTFDSRNVNFVKAYHEEHEDREYFIKGDQLEIIRILMNLIKNAAEELQANEWVIIRLSKTQESIILSVHDTGPKMDDEKKSQIRQVLEAPDLELIDRFSTKQRNSGWGLRIVRTYVEKNHGKIEFENDKEGSVFTITFPKA